MVNLDTGIIKAYKQHNGFEMRTKYNPWRNALPIEGRALNKLLNGMYNYAGLNKIPGYNIKNWKPHSNIKKPGPFSGLKGPLYGLFAG
jgi:hypothetical protein